MEIYLIIGIVVGLLIAAIVWFFMGKRTKELEQRLASQDGIISEKDIVIAEQNTEVAGLKDALSQMRIDLAVKDNQYQQAKEDIRRGEDALRQAEENMKRNEESLKRGEEAVKQQMELVREQMLNATSEMLKARQTELTANNKEQIGAILSPLQQEIKQMKEAVDRSKESQTEAQTTLKTQIDMLMRQSMDIGSRADRLATALTAETKTQGNFGEVKLIELLESMELEKGIHFDIQETMRDENGNTIISEEGKRLIPDVILHFTDNRDAIIDSKMSITAYENYVNATNEQERQDALKAHILSVRKHVDELSHKKYNQYIKKGHQSLHYVIMYMFSETALQLALCNDTGLWKYAFDKNVFITGSQNLYAILRLTKESWTLVEQTRNQEQIMKYADIIVQRVQAFSQNFQQIGSLIGDMQKTYEDIQRNTADKGSSIIVAARQLTYLGAHESKAKKAKSLPINEMFGAEDEEARAES